TIRIVNPSSGTVISAITLSGGTITTRSFITPDWSQLYFNSGTLNLSSGVSSNGGTFSIGSNGGSATLNQSGNSSVVSAPWMNLGVTSNSIGIYNLSDGSLTSALGQSIGNVGAGIVNQTGGANTVVGGWGGLSLGDATGAIGTYNLSGGSLQVTSGGNFVVGNLGA